MYIDYHQAEYIGGRDEQQDCAGTARLKDRAESHLFVLADGVGGHTGGATASRLAVDTVLEAATSGAFDDKATQREGLREIVDRANDRIRESIEATPRLDGMATTLVVAIVSRSRIRWVSVGDSHLYLLRGGRLHKLNEDHSYAALLVKAGKRAADDPELRDYKNLIASALSGDEIKYVDLPEKPERLEEGDIIVAATDGINTLADNHIEALLYEKRNAPASDMATALLTAVRRVALPNQDNATVIVGRLEGEAATTAPVLHEEEEEEGPPRTEPRPSAPPPPEPPRKAQAETPTSSRPASTAGVEPSGPRKSGSKLAIAALVVVALVIGGAYWAFKSGFPGQGAFSNIDSPLRELLPASRPPHSVGVRREVPEDLTAFKCYMYRHSQRLPPECEPYTDRWRPWGR